MVEQTQKDFDALRRDMEALRADLNALTTSIGELVGNKIDQAKAGAREAGEQVQQRAREARDSLGGQIEERPFTALFSAFGIGMILGALFGRRG
jgi:ElaB/YqjD/DUF883 family membrane-anchored ribosome-binding protein